mmetsp:Transcript_10913/g.16366  ORF Transcript_10913/g.16366 Transcript_10913/m.16366 type:complete len:256 (-) Transcript_10913:437-1204(-)
MSSSNTECIHFCQKIGIFFVDSGNKLGPFLGNGIHVSNSSNVWRPSRIKCTSVTLRNLLCGRIGTCNFMQIESTPLSSQTVRLSKWRSMLDLIFTVPFVSFSNDHITIIAKVSSNGSQQNHIRINQNHYIIFPGEKSVLFIFESDSMLQPIFQAKRFVEELIVSNSFSIFIFDSTKVRCEMKKKLFPHDISDMLFMPLLCYNRFFIRTPGSNTSDGSRLLHLQSGVKHEIRLPMLKFRTVGGINEMIHSSIISHQ